MTDSKRYSKEFKLDALSLVVDQGHTRSELSKMLGVNPKQFLLLYYLACLAN